MHNHSAPQIKPKRAIVIGGSIAGLLTARILADFFSEVLLLERDQFPTHEPDFRKGVPQAKHQHILLTKGREIFENLFPGFDQELANTGAELADHTQDMQLFSAHGKLPRFKSGVVLRLASRIQIDWIFLGRLRKIPNIKILENTSVYALTHQEGTVTGVRLADESVLRADFVVDATGRGSRTPQWLEQLGYPLPMDEIIDAKLGYASRFYERNPNSPTDFKAIAMTPVPLSNPRAVGLWQVEGNRWLLTLIGTAGHYPPIEEADFNQFAMALADPVVAETIANLKPCSDIVSFKGTANRWRHFEKLKEFPANYLVLGDAYCALSPFYGQGMTVAGLAALTLQTALQKFCHSATPDFRSVQKYYFRKTSAQFKAPWIIATGEDLRWPTTTGAAPDLVMRVSNRIMDQLLPLSTTSELLVRNFLRISNMVASPATLLDPRILFQLVRFWMGK